MATTEPHYGFEGDTLIRVKDGYKEIQELRVGDLVKSHPHDEPLQSLEDIFVRNKPVKRPKPRYRKITSIDQLKVRTHYSMFAGVLDRPSNDIYFGASQRFHVRLSHERPKERAPRSPLPWITGPEMVGMADRLVDDEYTPADFGRVFSVRGSVLLFSLQVEEFHTYCVGPIGLLTRCPD